VGTKGTEVDQVTIEAGHAYLEKLKNGEDIPPPDQDTLNTVQDFLSDHGVDSQLITILDDTHSSVEEISQQEKNELAENYLSKWDHQPDSYHWESEAIQVWEDNWQNYQQLQNAVDPEDSKWCEMTCAALDAAMTAEKLGITDQTTIPSADKAVTQHDENYPLPSGVYSSFQGYDNQKESHQLQQQLHEQDAVPVPTFQDSYNLEFNPEELSNGELEEQVYQDVIA